MFFKMAVDGKLFPRAAVDNKIRLGGPCFTEHSRNLLTLLDWCNRVIFSIKQNNYGLTNTYVELVIHKHCLLNLYTTKYTNECIRNRRSTIFFLKILQIYPFYTFGCEGSG